MLALVLNTPLLFEDSSNPIKPGLFQARASLGGGGGAGGVIFTPPPPSPGKTTFKKSSLIRVNIRSHSGQQNKTKHNSKHLLCNCQIFQMTYIILHNFQNINLQTVSKYPVPYNLQIKPCLDQQENPLKIIQMILQLIISDLGWLALFCIICKTQICKLCLKTQFSANFK